MLSVIILIAFFVEYQFVCDCSPTIEYRNVRATGLVSYISFRVCWAENGVLICSICQLLKKFWMQTYLYGSSMSNVYV